MADPSPVARAEAEAWNAAIEAAIACLRTKAAGHRTEAETCTPNTIGYLIAMREAEYAEVGADTIRALCREVPDAP